MPSKPPTAAERRRDSQRRFRKQRGCFSVQARLPSALRLEVDWLREQFPGISMSRIMECGIRALAREVRAKPNVFKIKLEAK